jgi:hypothetical protein
MNHNTLGRFGGWALLVLAATQGLLLGLRPWPGSVASDPWLAAGDRLPYQEVHDALGRGVWAPSPAPSHPPRSCWSSIPGAAPATAVAPVWAQWIRDWGDRSPVVALSASLPGPAEAFARLHGWEAEVVALPPGNLAPQVRALTRRTPWVFVLDEGGRVVAEGHAARIAELVPLETLGLEVAG